MVDEGDELPERRVERVGELRLTLVSIVLVSVDLLVLIFLHSFNRSFLLFKHSIDILKVLFLLTLTRLIDLLSLLAFGCMDGDHSFLFSILQLRVELEDFKGDILALLE